MSKYIDNFLDYLIINKNVAKNTYDAYKRDLTQFEEFLKKDIIYADTKDIISFLSKIENKRSLNRKLSSINSFFEFAYKRDLVDKKHKVRQAKITHSMPKFITKEEILDAVSNIDTSTWIGARDKALILFLYATGVRVSEALNVKISDIQDNLVHINSKNKRVVIIAPIALEAINEYLNKRICNSEYLFINRSCNPLSRISAFKITKKYLNVSPHVLRHSFATSLILGGADLIVVKELLGHLNLSNTQIYTQIKKDSLKDIVLKYHPLGELN